MKSFFTISIIILTLGISFWLYDKNITEKTISSMSKVPESTVIHNFSDIYNVLNELKKDEIVMKNYLNENHSALNKDKVFEAYYSNLKKGCEYFDSVNYSEEPDDNTVNLWNSKLWEGYSHNYENSDDSSIHITPIMKRDDYKDYRVERLKITYPQVPFIEMIYSGEGYFSSGICYKYLYANYGKYLSPALKDYISLRAREENDLNGTAYYIDASITVSKATLMKWIMSWQEYKNKYPNFKSDYIDKALNLYTGDFLVSYENSFFQTFDFDDNLLPEAKEAYEIFLEKVNPKTKEYQIVSKCYDVLKENNLKYSNEFKTCVDAWKNKYKGNNDIWLDY